MIEKKAAAGKPADDFIRIQELWGLVVAIGLKHIRESVVYTIDLF